MTLAVPCNGVVLLVEDDDDDDTRDLLRTLIQRRGHRVRSAQDGKFAYPRQRQSSPGRCGMFAKTD